MIREQREELDAFYAAAYPRVVGLVGAIHGSRSEAEELVQDAFVRLIPRWTKVRNYDDPEAWLRKAALRLAVNRRRKIQNGLRAHRLLAQSAVPSNEGSEPTAAFEALRELSIEQRTVLFYFHYLDKDIATIARELQLPLGTVKSRLSRGRAQLQSKLIEGKKLNAEPW